ncbi:polysaccharide biosynthesis/export family protein [Hymenobacter setariae]|uniref:polysaccharide biosynthesis/export family protein n=1 Tax=Hymenobacter setariae TaxID=2594794 RepID=UPI001F2CB1A4|nr:polysaccharide biosynthesis/export family protein [Hymenobacter setariae]
MVIVLLASSCASSRKLTYFSNLDSKSDYKTEIKNEIEPKIQVDDLLGITVSSLSAESNMLYNSGTVATPASTISTSIASSPTAARSGEGYLVDKSGEVNLPVLGKIKLAGLTKEQAAEKLTDEVKKTVKNPTVNVRFLNFKITVIGEVNRPATFTVPTEKITVLEALGLAGDMTAYGRRENVLLIREKDGIRSAIRVDFTNKDLLSSPYFYLQQNDVVYVEPVKSKELQGSSSSFYLPIISVAASVISVLVFALTR